MMVASLALFLLLQQGPQPPAPASVAPNSAPAGAGSESAEARRLHCGDDRGVDRCDASQQQRVRTAFGVPDAATLHREGATVRRGFLVDGYGRDMPAISFERRPGQSPRVVVRVLRLVDRRGSGTRRMQEMSAPVSLATWNEVLARTRLGARASGPPAPVDGAASPFDGLPLCLHSWVATFESVDQGFDGGVRRRTDDACNGSTTVEASMFLSQAALRALPECTALNRDRFRNEATMLEACTYLEGDRVAAAEAVNQLEQSWLLNPASDRVGAIRYLFSSRAEINWAGEPRVVGYREASDLWTRKLSQPEGWDFWPLRHLGETADRVRMQGEMWRTIEGGSERAPAEIVWLRENGDFVIASMTVGAAEVVRR